MRELDAVTRRTTTSGGRTAKAFNPLSRDDLQLFHAVMDGEHNIRGFTNADIRQRLSRTAHLNSLTDTRSQSAKVTRILHRFHAHGLIAKIPHSRRWRTTRLGRRLMATAIQVRQLNFPQLLALADVLVGESTDAVRSVHHGVEELQVVAAERVEGLGGAATRRGLAASDAVELIRRGDIDGASFAFVAVGEKWSTLPDGKALREILDVDLYDIAPATYPAYSTTSASMRTAADVFKTYEARKKEGLMQPKNLRKRTTSAKPTDRATTRSAQTININKDDDRRRAVAESESNRFRNFGEMALAVARAGSPAGVTDERLIAMQKRASGHAAEPPSAGGYLLEQTYSDAILTRAIGRSEVLRQHRRLLKRVKGVALYEVDCHRAGFGHGQTHLGQAECHRPQCQYESSRPGQGHAILLTVG